MKTCTKCSVVKPLTEFNKHKDGLTTRCKSCVCEIARVWRDANPERRKEWTKQNYWMNRAKSLEASRVYRATHPDRVKQLSKTYAERNKDVLAAKSRAWYAANREYAKQKAKEWRALHPEQVRATLSNLKARRKKADGRHTAQDIKDLFTKQNGRCLGCSADLSLGYNVDHIMPLSKGGTDWPENLQLLCVSCNRRKGRKLPDQWLAMLGKQPAAA